MDKKISQQRSLSRFFALALLLLLIERADLLRAPLGRVRRAVKLAPAMALATLTRRALARIGVAIHKGLIVPHGKKPRLAESSPGRALSGLRDSFNGALRE